MSAPITMTGYMGAIVIGAPFVMDYGNRAAEELVRVADVRPADEACCKVRVEGMTGWFSEIEFRRRAMPFIPATATPGEVERLRELLLERATVACDAECDGDRGLHDIGCQRATAALSSPGLAAKAGVLDRKYDPMAHGMMAKTEVDRLAILLFEAFAKAEPREGITRYPASYWATFADMARAVIADRATATPGALDPATVEREWLETAHKARVETFKQQRQTGVVDAIDWLVRYTEQFPTPAMAYEAGRLARKMRDAIAPEGTTLLSAALATDPHQHGGKGA